MESELIGFFGFGGFTDLKDSLPEKSTPQSPIEKGPSVIVYTYNLLTHCFATPTVYPDAPEECLDSTYRHARVLEKLNAAIAHHSCDLRLPQYPIFCFQECDYAWVNVLQPYFSALNYQFVFSVYQYGSFGVAIAYPHVYVSTKCLINTPQHRLKMNWKVRNTWSGLLAKQNVRIALRLYPRKHPHQIFWVYTYHMPNLYRDPVAQYTFTAIVKKDILAVTDNEPAIITGDFNILPMKDSFNLLTNSGLPDESKIVPMTGEPGEYPYDFVLEDLPGLKCTPIPTHTVWCRVVRTDIPGPFEVFKDVLDYIFYIGPYASSKSISLESLDTTAHLMPNKTEPSDHLMIGAIIDL